jgi:hypothetical protein
MRKMSYPDTSEAADGKKHVPIWSSFVCSWRDTQISGEPAGPVGSEITPAVRHCALEPCASVRATEGIEVSIERSFLRATSTIALAGAEALPLQKNVIHTPDVRFAKRLTVPISHDEGEYAGNAAAQVAARVAKVKLACAVG